MDVNTRMVHLRFNLFNGNDFDPDNHYLHTKGNAKFDDQYLVAELRHVIDQSGFWVKYDRMVAVRPMRKFFYLDQFQKQGFFVFWCLCLLCMLCNELSRLREVGFRIFFFQSRNAFWNNFEIVFYCILVYTFVQVYNFWILTTDIEERLLDRTRDLVGRDVYTDITDLPEDFRAMMRGVGGLCFFSILKIFKFMSLNMRLSLLVRVILHAKSMIAVFLVAYFLFTLAFSFLTQYMFGWYSRDFHNLASAFFAMIRTPPGESEKPYENPYMTRFVIFTRVSARTKPLK